MWRVYWRHVQDLKIQSQRHKIKIKSLKVGWGWIIFSPRTDKKHLPQTKTTRFSWESSFDSQWLSYPQPFTIQLEIKDSHSENNTSFLFLFIMNTFIVLSSLPFDWQGQEKEEERNGDHVLKIPRQRLFWGQIVHLVLSHLKL